MDITKNLSKFNPSALSEIKIRYYTGRQLTKYDSSNMQIPVLKKKQQYAT